MSNNFGFSRFFTLKSNIFLFLKDHSRYIVYVADQKPQAMISFFPIYTKQCYIKSGLNDKFKSKVYKCLIQYIFKEFWHLYYNSNV